MRFLGEKNGAGPALGGGSPGGGQTVVQPVVAAGPVPDFSLSLELRGDGTAVLALAGELDLYRAPEIEQALAEAIGADGGDNSDQRPCRLVVDLRSVTFVDSTTLGLLLAASRRERARGAGLRILVGPETPMTAFVVTGVDRLLAISRVDDSPNGRAAYPTPPEHAAERDDSPEP